jgi:hypothetical protein
MTQLPRRRDNSNCSFSSVVDLTTGAGFPNNGDAAVSRSSGDDTTSTTKKSATTTPTTPAINDDRRLRPSGAAFNGDEFSLSFTVMFL